MHVNHMGEVKRPDARSPRQALGSKARAWRTNSRPGSDILRSPVRSINITIATLYNLPGFLTFSICIQIVTKYKSTKSAGVCAIFTATVTLTEVTLGWPSGIKTRETGSETVNIRVKRKKPQSQKSQTMASLIGSNQTLRKEKTYLLWPRYTK